VGARGRGEKKENIKTFVGIAGTSTKNQNRRPPQENIKI
jgi:hypothetical protein